MQILRSFLGLILVLVLLFDTTIIYDYLSNGWPTDLIVHRLDAEGRAAYEVRPMPMTREAWFIVVSYGVLHVLLIYGVWRLRPSRLQKLKT